MKTTALRSLFAVFVLLLPFSQVFAQPFDGSVAAGEEKAAPCAACHGMDGDGILPEYPNIGGQYADYLYRTLKAYQSGERANAIMAGQVSRLSDRDLRDLAAYYAAQDGLYVPRKD